MRVCGRFRRVVEFSFVCSALAGGWSIGTMPGAGAGVLSHANHPTAGPRAAPPAGGIALVAPTVEGAPGALVDLPIDLRAGGAVGALEFILSYDPAVLQATGPVRAGPTAGGGLIESKVRPGRVGITFASLEPPGRDGTLFVVRFKVIGRPGQQSPLAFESLRAWEPSVLLADIPVAFERGVFQVAVAGGRDLPLTRVGAMAVFGLTLAVLWRLRSRVQPAPAPPATPEPKGGTRCP